jgi:hypothetical protein
VRQGCDLFPIVFNIYLDDLIQKWKNKAYPAINIGKRPINNLLFVDDLVLISYKEKTPQLLLFQLNEISKEYNMRISIKKNKVMAFNGKYPIRTKIIIDNNPTEQISYFQYLGCDVTYRTGDKNKKSKNFRQFVVQYVEH